MGRAQCLECVFRTNRHCRSTLVPEAGPCREISERGNLVASPWKKLTTRNRSSDCHARVHFIRDGFRLGTYYIRSIAGRSSCFDRGETFAIACDAGCCSNRELCLSSDIGHGSGFAELSRTSIEFLKQVYCYSLLYSMFQSHGYIPSCGA